MADHSHPLAYIGNVIPFRPTVRTPAVLYARDAIRSAAIERWENEGGYFPKCGDDRQSQPRRSIANEATYLTAQVHRMAGRLFSDFADGIVETSNFAHRSRILRQLISRLNAIRETGPEPSR